MRHVTFMLCVSAGLAACGQASDEMAANTADAASNAAAPAKRPAYCFFKDAETKGWSASTDSNGHVIVTGKAYRSDPRYKAVLGPAEVAGGTATLSPTIQPNSGYASPDNWWDVSATIPNSQTVQSVTVQCGKKTLAELNVPRP